MMKKHILSVKKFNKIYGLNKNEAAKMLKAGAEKNEVLKKTGVTSAIWDMSFDVKTRRNLCYNWSFWLW